MQCTLQLWLHTLNARKTWATDINWINGKKRKHRVNKHKNEHIMNCKFLFLIEKGF